MEEFLKPYLQRQVLKYAIGRQLTCPIKGTVLDVRRAVLVETESGQTVAVISKAAYDELEAKGGIHSSLVLTKGWEL